jgi:hypothetical protein
MIRSKNWIRAVIVLAFAAATLSAQPGPAQSPSSKFVDLLKRAKSGDASLDFKELRFAYTDTAEYNPYGGDREARNKMFAALNAKDYEVVRQQAEVMLAKNFLDLNGQFGAFVAHRGLGNTEKANLHKFLFEGLVHSIEKSGDGKSAATAFVVISVDEEYVLINFMGLRPAGQSLVQQNGHSYDVMKAVNSETNETAEFYFNIDKPYNWLGKKLK